MQRQGKTLTAFFLEISAFFGFFAIRDFLSTIVCGAIGGQDSKPFVELDKNKVEIKAFGVTIPVLGIDDLIEIKEKAGRSTDLFDVQQLRRIKERHGR